MGRDDFSVTPAYSGTEISNKPLIVEDKRPRGCTCFLVALALAAVVAVYALTALDPVQMNLELLAVDSPELQEYAINNLAGLGDPAAVEPLVGYLSSPDSNVRETAAWALGEIRSVDGVDPLLAVVNTEADYDLSYYAVSSLIMIASRCPDGTPRGEACIDDAVAGRVTDYLIDQAKTDPYVPFIVSNSLFLPDVDARILAAQLMAHIATEEERYMLEAALEDGDGRVSRAADLALAELDARTSAEPGYVPPADGPNPPTDGMTVPAEPSEDGPPIIPEPPAEPSEDGLPTTPEPPKELEPVSEPL